MVSLGMYIQVWYVSVYGMYLYVVCICMWYVFVYGMLVYVVC